MHVWYMQTSELMPAHAEAHFSPSQKPGIKNSIDQSAQSSGGSMPPWAPIPPYLCSQDPNSNHHLSTRTSCPKTQLLGNEILKPTSICCSQRDVTEMVPHRALESHKAGAPLSFPLFAFSALSFPGENYCPHCSQIQSGSHSAIQKGKNDLHINYLTLLLDLKVKCELFSYLFHCIQQSLQ